MATTAAAMGKQDQSKSFGRQIEFTAQFEPLDWYNDLVAGHKQT